MHQTHEAWLEEMEGRMRKDLANLRGAVAVSNQIPETPPPTTDPPKAEAVGSMERASTSDTSDRTERPE